MGRQALPRSGRRRIDAALAAVMAVHRPAALADMTPAPWLEAGVAYLVVVGEGGACRCPFGVWRQKGVGRLSGTTALPPSHDKTHQLTSPREHLFPRLACSGVRVSLGVWRSKATCGSRQANAPGRGSDRGRPRPPKAGPWHQKSACGPSAATSTRTLSVRFHRRPLVKRGPTGAPTRPLAPSLATR
jgi:hypothetical protein